MVDRVIRSEFVPRLLLDAAGVDPDKSHAAWSIGDIQATLFALLFELEERFTAVECVVNEAVLQWGDATGHDGAGWYYWDAEYQDEGPIGAFPNRREAEAHAREAGYNKFSLKGDRISKGGHIAVEPAEATPLPPDSHSILARSSFRHDGGGSRAGSPVESSEPREREIVVGSAVKVVGRTGSAYLGWNGTVVAIESWCPNAPFKVDFNGGKYTRNYAAADLEYVSDPPAPSAPVGETGERQDDELEAYRAAGEKHIMLAEQNFREMVRQRNSARAERDAALSEVERLTKERAEALALVEGAQRERAIAWDEGFWDGIHVRANAPDPPNPYRARAPVPPVASERDGEGKSNADT